jgi:hypothetical protein
MMGYEILDPVVEPVTPEARLAPRLDTLEGKVIGLWSNQKINATELLDEAGRILTTRHRISGTRRGTYNAGRVMRPQEWGDIDGCDAVLLTHGD